MGLLDRISRSLFGPSAEEAAEAEETPVEEIPEAPHQYGRLSAQKNLDEPRESTADDASEAPEGPARLRGWARWHRKIHRQFQTEPSFGNPLALRRFKRFEKRLDTSYKEAAAGGRESLIDWQRTQRRSIRSPFQRMMKTYTRALREGKEALERRGASSREINRFERDWKTRYKRIERTRGKFLSRSRKVTGL